MRLESRTANGAMKTFLIVLFFAASAVAQSKSSHLPAACGPEDGTFDVSLDKSQHTIFQPEPGKARVYFFQDASDARIGLDGAWVGANQTHSYFSVSVDPGEHHLCAKMDFLGNHPVEALHFTAEPGKLYFFRTRLIPAAESTFMFFNLVDSDEAKFLVTTYSLSVPKAKK